MNNPIIIFLILLALLVTACTGENQVANQTASTTDLSSTEIVALPEATETSLPRATFTIKPSETALPPLPTETALPTTTPLPTDTPLPTETSLPTDTPLPTETSLPTETALPPQAPPTETLKPIRTPLPFLTPMNTPNPNGEIIHVVASGDTILGIAVQYGVVDNQIIAYNQLESKELSIGQEIRITVGMMSQRYTGTGGSATSTPLPVASDETRVVLGPFTFDWQKINNCGPTTTSIMLSYYDIDLPQLTVANVLKPNSEDKNVSPAEVAAYVRQQGFGAFIGVNGDIALIERLLAAGFPVMVEQWMHYDGGVGHYRAARGYDRDKALILQEDSFLGPDTWRSYEEFNQDWAYFNNTYLVFYPPEDEQRVAELIGGDWDTTTMWQRALETFSPQDNGLGLYGKAEALHQLGRDAEAIPVYEQAIAKGLPERYFWYRFGYVEALNNVGQYQKTLEFSQPILEAMELSEDIRYHRAMAYKALGQTEKAQEELRLALEDNPNYVPAQLELSASSE